VALSVGLLPLAVNQHPARWSSDFPRTSRNTRFGRHAIASPTSHSDMIYLIQRDVTGFVGGGCRGSPIERLQRTPRVFFNRCRHVDRQNQIGLGHILGPGTDPRLPPDKNTNYSSPQTLHKRLGQPSSHLLVKPGTPVAHFAPEPWGPVLKLTKPYSLAPRNIAFTEPHEVDSVGTAICSKGL